MKNNCTAITASSYPKKTGYVVVPLGQRYPIRYPAKNPAFTRVFSQLGYPGYLFYLKDFHESTGAELTRVALRSKSLKVDALMPYTLFLHAPEDCSYAE